jgi:hypothetical protein
LPNISQSALTQHVGVTLSRLRKLDDLVRDRLLHVVVRGTYPQGDAHKLKRYAEDAHRFLIEPLAV